jgi:putative hydrolase of the HAD superfamily
MALKYFAEQPGAMCYVGDNPEKDFAGPMELGIKTVWVKREDGVHTAKYVSNPAMKSVKVDYTVQALTELLGILEND